MAGHRLTDKDTALLQVFLSQILIQGEQATLDALRLTAEGPPAAEPTPLTGRDGS